MYKLQEDSVIIILVGAPVQLGKHTGGSHGISF